MKVVTTEANEQCLHEKTKGQPEEKSKVQRLKAHHVRAALEVKK